jgi:site-specific DNA-methyltransferase (adenine-specific)
MQKTSGKNVRAKMNRTIDLEEGEFQTYLSKCINEIPKKDTLRGLTNKTLNGDTLKLLPLLPDKFVDLVFVDPPYNLTKSFNGKIFKELSDEMYEEWLESWVKELPRIMKSNASIYLCGDWKNSSAIYRVLKKHFIVKNRITFEREKGRGAKGNWKNASEDIWFATVSNDYHFDVEAVKLKRKVIAPYRDTEGKAKDWEHEGDEKYRLTHPSNLWTDITIPFWSMPENTDHPTQKPEKLVAKTILASSPIDGFVFDPFLGSGTTSVVAKKLGRKYLGIELDSSFSALAEKRLAMANKDKTIQGYKDGVFWERNSGQALNKANSRKDNSEEFSLFMEFDDE